MIQRPGMGITKLISKTKIYALQHIEVGIARNSGQDKLETGEYSEQAQQ